MITVAEKTKEELAAEPGAATRGSEKLLGSGALSGVFGFRTPETSWSTPPERAKQFLTAQFGSQHAHNSGRISVPPLQVAQ